jgi:hypothetical protein
VKSNQAHEKIILSNGESLGTTKKISITECDTVGLSERDFKISMVKCDKGRSKNKKNMSQ